MSEGSIEVIWSHLKSLESFKSWGDKISYNINMQHLLSFFVGSHNFLYPKITLHNHSYFTVSRPAWQCNYQANREGLTCQKAVKTMSVQVTYQEKNGFKKHLSFKVTTYQVLLSWQSFRQPPSIQPRMQGTKNRYKFHK